MLLLLLLLLLLSHYEARKIKSGVTGPAPVTLEWKSTSVKKTTTTAVVHAYIVADALHACSYLKTSGY